MHIYMRTLKTAVCTLAILFTFLQSAIPQDPGPKRPKIWGIAKMTFYINSFEDARDYYSRFLGYEEAFTYSSDMGEILSFKINDRQFLEFIESSDPQKKGEIVSVSFDCEKPQEMENYLISRSVDIKNSYGVDGAGNEIVRIQSSEYYLLEFISYMPEGKHKQTKGELMPASRISNRLHHAGLFVSDIEKADALYKEILGFKEMWRFKEDNSTMPNYIYLLPPNCVENIEYLYNEDRRSSHPSFMVEDMQEMLYTLKERTDGESLPNPMIGKGKRWLFNIRNSDGARIEFTEPYTVR